MTRRLNQDLNQQWPNPVECKRRSWNQLRFLSGRLASLTPRLRWRVVQKVQLLPTSKCGRRIVVGWRDNVKRTSCSVSLLLSQIIRKRARAVHFFIKKKNKEEKKRPRLQKGEDRAEEDLPRDPCSANRLMRWNVCFKWHTESSVSHRSWPLQLNGHGERTCLQIK